jgi:hypothetical protein
MTAKALPPNSARRPEASLLKTLLTDAYRGFVEVSHNGLALLGTALAVAAITLVARPDLRTNAEQHLLGWLLQRHEAPAVLQAAANGLPESTEAVNTLTPADLPKAQANVVNWLSRKYRVAPEPLSVLVAEAFVIGQKQRLDPTLILAVMAVESRFNPYAQSPVGAQGLMQVLTRVHTDKYEDFGGHMAAFDPVSNLRVGVKVLQDCIRRDGSVEGGLRCYVGAVTTDGSWYINRVMSEHLRIQSVALGKPMPTSFPEFTAVPAAMTAPDLPTQTGLLEAEPPPAPTGLPATAVTPETSLSSS